MSLYDELPVFKTSYDLLLNIFQFTANFSREYKYTIGEKLKNETLALILLVYRANSSQSIVRNRFLENILTYHSNIESQRTHFQYLQLNLLL